MSTTSSTSTSTSTTTTTTTLPIEVLVNTDDIKNYLGDMDEITISEENILQQMIDGVQSLFEAYLGYNLDRDWYVEFHDGEYTNKIFPKNIPIQRVFSIHESTDETWDSTTLQAASEYTIAYNTYIQFYTHRTLNYPQAIRISYQAGYSSDTIPQDIKLALIEQVAYKFTHEYKGRNLGVSAKTEQDGTMNYMANKLLPGVMMVLNRYRKFNLV